MLLFELKLQTEPFKFHLKYKNKIPLTHRNLRHIMYRNFTELCHFCFEYAGDSPWRFQNEKNYYPVFPPSTFWEEFPVEGREFEIRDRIPLESRQNLQVGVAQLPANILSLETTTFKCLIIHL